MILAIDTSTQWMGIALLQDAQILYEKVWRTSRRHTVELAPAIQEAVQDCGLQISDLETIGVALGPGSFTSLRIGLAVAKGLALTQRIPVIGIPSLDITAAGLPAQDIPLIAVLRAGRERLAAQTYQADNGRWKAAGEISHHYRAGVGNCHRQPHAGVRRTRTGRTQDIGTPLAQRPPARPGRLRAPSGQIGRADCRTLQSRPVRRCSRFSADLSAYPQHACLKPGLSASRLFFYSGYRKDER